MKKNEYGIYVINPRWYQLRKRYKLWKFKKYIISLPLSEHEWVVDNLYCLVCDKIVQGEGDERCECARATQPDQTTPEE